MYVTYIRDLRRPKSLTDLSVCNATFCNLRHFFQHYCLILKVIRFHGGYQGFLLLLLLFMLLKMYQRLKLIVYHLTEYNTLVSLYHQIRTLNFDIARIGIMHLTMSYESWHGKLYWLVSPSHEGKVLFLQQPWLNRCQYQLSSRFIHSFLRNNGVRGQ